MNQLEQNLISRINEQGPIPFRDFMQAALYDPEFGYYNTERLKIGPAGDYYTSSNVHSAFGATLARAFMQLWQELSGPDWSSATGGSEQSAGAESAGPAGPDARRRKPLVIVEAGAGTGRLAGDVLTALSREHEDISGSVDYLILETSPAMRATERAGLAGFGRQVAWCDMAGLERDLAGRDAIVFSNELLDALPVHQVRRAGSGTQELYVTTRQRVGAEPAPADEGLALAWGEPSTQRLAAYLSRMPVSLAEGQIVEVNLDAVSWLTDVARALRRGFLVTIDYGDRAEHLYGPDRLRGTLRCFHNHRLVDSPIVRVGEQDITSSVNFTALMEYGKDLGLDTVSYERQAAFLTRMGLIDRIAAVTRANEGTMDDIRERLALKSLFVPGGVSDNFRVLIQRKR